MLILLVRNSSLETMKTSQIIVRRNATRPMVAAMAMVVALLVGCDEQAPAGDAGQPNDVTAPADVHAVDDAPRPGDAPRPDAPAGSDAGTPGSAPKVWLKAKYAVETTKAVVYAKGIVNSNWGSTKGKEVSLLLDAFTPKGHTNGLRPAILFIHGGGFVGGTRTQGALVAQAKYFAARGWFTVSIDYRLAGSKGTVPALWAQTAKKVVPGSAAVANALYLAGRDAKAAVRWLHFNAAKYRVDPKHIAVAGGSAGAYTAIGIGASEPADFRDELTNAQDPTRASTHLKASSKVAAIIDYWGGPTLITGLEVVYGKKRFGPGDPPLMIVHGTADKTVKFSLAQELEKHWKTSGEPYAFYVLQGAGHGPWNAKYKGKTLVELTFDFLVARQGLDVK